ncbi:MAG: TetR/AcrR family transcriptional regulator [Blastocatellia bacterium]
MARPKTDDPVARAKIMAAAEVLFAEHGFAGVGIRQIAAAAGVNGAMIHYYFGNKESLYRAIIENAAMTVRGLIADATASATTLEERLTRFVKAYAGYIFGHPHLARILLREMMAGGKHVFDILPKYIPTNYAMLRGAMTEAVSGGELRDIDVDLAPISLIGMIVVFQLIRPLITHGLGKVKFDDQFIERLAAHTVDLFLNGAATRDKQGAGGRAKQATAARRAKVKR